MTLMQSGNPWLELGGAGDWVATRLLIDPFDYLRGLPPEGVLPPVDGPFTVGPASRLSDPGQSLWDQSGGEWRYFNGDDYHNPHWDYNPWSNYNTPWRNVPIGNLPPVK